MARHTLIVPTLLLAGWAMVAVAVPRQQQQQPPATPQQPPEVSFTIRGGPGTLPHFAVPDFLALTIQGSASRKPVAAYWICNSHTLRKWKP